MKRKIEWLMSEWKKRPSEYRKTNWDIWLFKLQIERDNPEMLDFKDLVHDKYEYLKTILKLDSLVRK